MEREVAYDSSEWWQLDHQLQVITGKSSIKLASVARVEEAGESGGGWVEAAINITDFSKEYYNKIVERQVPLEELVVQAGHINIHKFSSQPYKIFTFLMCRVWLGTISSSPSGAPDCDSRLMPSDCDDETFQYNFLLSRHDQYQVEFRVSFSISEEREFKLIELSCCNCENRVPATYCLTEKLYFC
jgi:hypothetical protein